jgi:hypothetical protein
MFSSDGQCGVPAQPDVLVSPGNASAIKQALDGASPQGLTPTAAAIDRAVAWLSQVVDANGHAHYLLVATDGEPNCKGGGGAESDSPAAIAAVEHAAQAGIHTFVVGIGSNTGADQTLTEMAKAGKEPAPGGKPYYSVSTTQELVKVLQGIAGQLVSCIFPLQMVPPNPDLVRIQSNGHDVMRDPTHMNGWDFGPGDKSIVFYGPACDYLQGFSTSVNATFGCPAVF